MTTHFIISADQITNSVSVATGAFPKKSVNGKHYVVYLTAIISNDPLIKNRVFAWGTTPGVSIFPDMIDHSEKGHYRVLAIVLFHCVWQNPFSLLLDPLSLKNLSKPLLFKS